jgi:curved DNA-binding protein CbpA
MKRDFYAVLQIDRSASAEELKKAYRRRARETHPDRNEGDSTAFKEVKRAYDFLSDEGKRKQYDRLIELKESGELDRRLREARFSRVPPIPVDLEEAQTEEPHGQAPRHGGPVDYEPPIPADAAMHPEVPGWYVNGAAGGVAFAPNPYYDPDAEPLYAPSGYDLPPQPGTRVVVQDALLELLELISKRRW